MFFCNVCALDQAQVGCAVCGMGRRRARPCRAPRGYVRLCPPPSTSARKKLPAHMAHSTPVSVAHTTTHTREERERIRADGHQ